MAKFSIKIDIRANVESNYSKHVVRKIISGELDSVVSSLDLPDTATIDVKVEEPVKREDKNE